MPWGVTQRGKANPIAASSIPSFDPSCGPLNHSAFLAQLLLEEVDRESTSEATSPVGKPVLHMQHTCSGEPVSLIRDALAGLLLITCHCRCMTLRNSDGCCT